MTPSHRTTTQTSLERQLELLEARFTMPHLTPTDRSQQQQQQQKHDKQQDQQYGDDEDASVATLGPLSSPHTASRLLMQQQQQQQSQQHSHHSFGFDTPSLSTAQNTASQLSSSNTSLMAARKNSSRSPTNFSAVQAAAARHMAKVAALNNNNNNNNNGGGDISNSLLSSSSSSAATLLTGHIQSQQSQMQALQQKQTVVQESPAVVEHPQQQQQTFKKRKSSVPIKRNAASVQEAAVTGNTCGGVAAATTATATTATATSKRPRSSNGNGINSRKSANAYAATSPPSKRTIFPSTAAAAAAAATIKPNKKSKKDRSLYDFFSSKSTVSTIANANRKAPSGNDKSAAAAAAAAVPQTPPPTTGINSSNNNNNNENMVNAASTDTDTKADYDTTDNNTNSRDYWKTRCEELETTVEEQQAQLAAVSNNRTILHTALAANLKRTQHELQLQQQQHAQFEQSAQRVLEDLVRQEATRQAVETREQLAANGARLGRIVYVRAGMRSVEQWEEGHAWLNHEQAVAQLQDKKRQFLKRQDAAKRAVQKLRETNATTTKNGNTGQQHQQENDSGGNNNNDDDDDDDDDENSETVGGCVIRTQLDGMEAIESVRYHLECLRQKENSLKEAEVRLCDEKAAHIRALKRVASEDASRFRSRPKLNDRYVLQHLLGKGGFSEVWRAFDLVDFREVAVKIHQLDPRWSDSKKENYTKHVSREYEIHRNVRHPRIVSLFDVFEIDNNSFATVLECCSGKDLELLLKEKGRLLERDARAILLQILSGMQYLSHPSADGSRQGIIHYDLKPGNILFDENGDAKITDFGLSKIVDTPDPAESMELTSQGAGTYWYLPPECFVMEDNVRISNKVDVWSIGVIFYQMLFGKRPFGDGVSQDKILVDQTMLNAHEVKFPEKIDISEECKRFLRAALTYDQAFRPSIAQLCENPYILQKQF